MTPLTRHLSAAEPAPRSAGVPPAAPAAPERVLDVRGVTKRFPGVVALRAVAFDVLPGEVHVLFGENGAGKSTLVNVVAGTYAPDEGTVAVRGRAIEKFTPDAARSAGVNAVFQDLSLVPTLSVAENLTLGREPGRAGFVSRSAGTRYALDALRELDDEIDPRARVDTLSRAQQQLVEVAKALIGDPAVLILDEPTTALTEREVDRLFEIVAELRRRRLGIIYITHRMQEIWRIADRITVLRDGEWMATLEASQVGEERLIELMTGRSVETLYPQAKRSHGRPLLRLENVSGGAVADASLEVRGGEIVGVAGLVGSGKSDLGRLCFGLEPLTGGRVIVGDDPPRTPSPRDLLERGVVYYPADRRDEGLVPMRSVRENIVLPALGAGLTCGGLLRRAAQRKAAADAIARLRIHPPDPDRPVSQLSGGNQQKVVLARALLRDARLHIFDEPTAGVDVGARVEVYEFIRQLCEGGRAVLLISSDLPEVVNLSHRVYVVHNGRVRAHLDGDAVTEENVLSNFFDTADR